MAKARKSPTPPAPLKRTRKPARPSARAPKPAGREIELLRIAALALLCIVIWCTVYGRLSGDAWSLPVEYGTRPDVSDAQSDIAAFKAAQDGHFWPIIFHSVPQLGAPYAGNWNDYPVTEDILIFAAGILGKMFGLFAGANILIMLLHLLAAVAFYYSARRLKCDWKWAFTGALFFGLAPYGFAHSLHHFVITAYWHVALGLMVTFWLSNGRGLRFGTRDYYIAIGVAVATGWQNVYYTNIFIQMVGIALIIQWLRHGWRAALPAFSIGCAAFAAFMVMNLDTIGYALLNGHNPSAATRNYTQMEYYGLKLVDWFMPYPTHRIALLGALGRRFYTLTALPAEIPPACYFGFVGLAAFLWMAAATVRNAIARDHRRIPLESVLTLWIFLYATVGGINGMAGVFGFELFRSTTRYCIVILGISLMFAVRRLSLISRRWPAPWPILAPILICVIGLWEFVPPIAGEDIAITNAAVSSDRLFAQQMEASLPKAGMVFQLPVMDYPESPIPGVSAYEHFRPYFYTKDLRYSYGSDKGRVQDAWQRVVAAMPPAGQVAALESYGFSAIYINAAAYPDHAQSLLAQFKAAGRDQVIPSQRQDLFCIVLKPSPNPILPPPGPLFASGWYSEQDNPNGQRDRLASGDSVIILTNTSSAPIQKYANFYLASLAPRNVVLQGANTFQTWHVDQQHSAPVTNLPLTLPPGETRLQFKTDAPGTQQGIGLITFDVINFDLSDQPHPAP